MLNKSFFTVSMYGVSMASLSAQVPSQFHVTQQPNCASIVDCLAQNALLLILGIVVFMGVCWCYFIFTEYTSLLRKEQKNGHWPAMSLLAFALAMSISGSSCTAAQRARAAEYRAAQEVENRRCPMNQHRNEQENTSFNNRSFYNGYSNWHGHAYCRFCGQPNKKRNISRIQNLTGVNP
jgi:hypothetical protein